MKKVEVGNPLIRLQTVDSTNNYAAQLIKQGSVQEGTVILAVHQTQGKGQAGSRWLSEEGANLLLSAILKPDFLPADKQFYLSMCIATAIADFIERYNVPAMIKWPNDIMIRKRKVGGILIENTIMKENLAYAIIGIGLNVNQTVFPEDLPNPTSLKLETGTEISLQTSLTSLFGKLNFHINQLYKGSFAPIKLDYLNKLWRMNTWAAYADYSGEFEGRIIDVTETGELVVMRRNGETKNHWFKEITFVDSDQ